MQIHIMLSGIEFGPYSQQKVEDLLAEGLVVPSDPARHEGQVDWTTVHDALAHPPPEPEVVAPLPDHSPLIEPRLEPHPFATTIFEPRSEAPPELARLPEAPGETIAETILNRLE